MDCCDSLAHFIEKWNEMAGLRLFSQMRSTLADDIFRQCLNGLFMLPKWPNECYRTAKRSEVHCVIPAPCEATSIFRFVSSALGYTFAYVSSSHEIDHVGWDYTCLPPTMISNNRVVYETRYKKTQKKPTQLDGKFTTKGLKGVTWDIYISKYKLNIITFYAYNFNSTFIFQSDVVSRQNIILVHKMLRALILRYRYLKLFFFLVLFRIYFFLLLLVEKISKWRVILWYNIIWHRLQQCSNWLGTYIRLGPHKDTPAVRAMGCLSRVWEL